MRFDTQKRRALDNLNASLRAGDVDLELIPLLEVINNLPDFYTTSSCSGRIVLMQEIGKKGTNRFIGKWHGSTPSVETLIELIKPSKGIIWFRYECPILHVVGRDISKANKFLQISREAGFKRSGIQSTKYDRILIEVLSTERIDVPVAFGEKIFIDLHYLEFLLKQAEVKQKIGLEKLKRLEQSLRKMT